MLLTANRRVALVAIIRSCKTATQTRVDATQRSAVSRRLSPRRSISPLARAPPRRIVLYYRARGRERSVSCVQRLCGRTGAGRGACTGTEGDRSFARRPGRGMARVWRRAGRPLSLPRPVPLGWLYWIAFADPATDRYAARVACVCPCVGLLAAAGWVCALVFGLAELRRQMGRTDALADMCLVAGVVDPVAFVRRRM